MKIKRFEFNMFPVNCYVLWDETNEAAIIDPGCYYEEDKIALKDFIANNGLTVKHLLNTHLHIDHICGNPFCERTFGVKSEANEADLYWVELAPKQSRMFGMKLESEPEPPATHLHDGTFVTFGNTCLEVIHVPGHSPGSIVFYNAAEGCLFSGDVLFQGSIGRADLAGGLKEFVRSYSYCLTIRWYIRDMEHLPPLAQRRKRILSSGYNSCELWTLKNIIN